MLSDVIINAQSRDTVRKSDVKTLRKNGQIPGIIYGKSGNKTISISAKDLPSGHTRSKIVKIAMDSDTTSVLMREVQVNPLNDSPVHIDFQEVSPETVVKVKIPLQYQGLTKEQEKEGSFKILLRSLEVKAPAQALPSSIDINVSEMKIDETIHISDIQIPSDVKVTAVKNLALASLVRA